MNRNGDDARGCKVKASLAKILNPPQIFPTQVTFLSLYETLKTDLIASRWKLEALRHCKNENTPSASSASISTCFHYLPGFSLSCLQPMLSKSVP